MFGTGKSTLINILLYLIGPEASYSTSLTNLNSRFGLSSISHKIFLVINDMTHFKGKEPKRLKEIITGDKLDIMRGLKFLSLALFRLFLIKILVRVCSKII